VLTAAFVVEKSCENDGTVRTASRWLPAAPGEEEAVWL
jgi:hypothetical protein